LFKRGTAEHGAPVAVAQTWNCRTWCTSGRCSNEELQNMVHQWSLFKRGTAEHGAPVTAGEGEQIFTGREYMSLFKRGRRLQRWLLRRTEK